MWQKKTTYCDRSKQTLYKFEKVLLRYRHINSLCNVHLQLTSMDDVNRNMPFGGNGCQYYSINIIYESLNVIHMNIRSVNSNLDELYI